MTLLTLRAYVELISLEPYLARKNFAGLYSRVRKQRVGKAVDSPQVIESICAAVDLACVWYWKEVLCLQRSAATWSARRDDDWRPANALQGPCVGRSRWSGGQ